MAFAGGVGPFAQVVGHFVVVEVVAHRFAEVAVGVAPLFGFPLLASRLVVRLAGGGCGVMVRLLEGGVVHHFVAHAVGQLGDGQLHQVGQRHLEEGELLRLYRRLILYEFLAHD